MTALVAWLWQGLLLAAAVIAAQRWATRLNAATRHVIYWAALCAVLLLPAAPVLMAALEPAPAMSDLVAVPLAPVQVALPDWIIAVGLGVWLGTVVLGMLRLGLGVRGLVLLRATSHPMADVRQRRLPLWSSVRGQGRRAELRQSQAMTGACAIGLARPVILVGETLADRLTDDQLDQVVIHEYAHLARQDDWSCLVQAVIASFVGLHPAVRLLGQRIDLEREAACDDYVVTRTGAVQPYAACLTEVAAIARLSARPRHALAPAATWARSTLHRRVLRLFERGRRHGCRVERRAALVTACVLGLAVFGASQIAPLIVFLEAEAGRPATDAANGARVVDETVGVLAPATATRGAPRVAADPVTTNARLSPVRGIREATPLARRLYLPAAVLGRAPTVTGHSPSATDAETITRSDRATTTTRGVATRIVRAPPQLAAPTVEPAAGATMNGTRQVAAPRLRGPWAVTGQRTAAAGVAAGTGARRAGTSIAGFFTRVGKALAQSF